MDRLTDTLGLLYLSYKGTTFVVSIDGVWYYELKNRDR